MERRVITDDGIALWTESAGSGKHLSLAHGGPGIWDYLRPLASLLEPFATVDRWDQRGSGRSDLAGPYGVDRFVRDMEEVRQSVGADRWIAGGHSWGAVMSLIYAIRYPEHTMGVLYIAGYGLEWDEWRDVYKREFEKRLGGNLQRFRDTEDESELNRLRWSVDYASPEAAGPEVERMLAQPFRVNQECNKSIGADMTAYSQTYFASIEDLQIPVLIIQGASDPRPMEACDSLAARLQKPTRVVLEGAGHFPWVESPGRFVSAVSEWITKLDPTKTYPL